MEMITCKRCGQRYEDRHRKCTSCGTRRVGWVPWLLVLALMALLLELVLLVAG